MLCELMWALISTVAAAGVVGFAVMTVGKQEHVPVKDDTSELTGFSAVLYNKYYVDEIYDRFIVQPIVRASRFCWRVVSGS